MTLEDIHGPGFGVGVITKDGSSTVNGIQAMAEQGIVGRGVLLDFHSWRLAQDPPIPYEPFKTGSIPLKYLKATAEAQGTVIKFGDILIIHSGDLKFEHCWKIGCADTEAGYMAAQSQKPESELSALKDVMPPVFSGVEQSEEMLRWIWENFSAVAGDQPSFECWRMLSSFQLPFIVLLLLTDGCNSATQQSYSLHEVLLAGWGMPIGELFDLEKLAEYCKKEKRWSFFVTSEVCNVPGGVASPPNILAIF